MTRHPHHEKLQAALRNPKCSKTDMQVLSNVLQAYQEWRSKIEALQSRKKELVREMTSCLNWYKDLLEVELIMKSGSTFLRRQKGQLKLDNSVIEEFLIDVICPEIIAGLDLTQVVVGPTKTFMSVSFLPPSFTDADSVVSTVFKEKDMDFVVGKKVYYAFSTNPDLLSSGKGTQGDLNLGVVAAECKVNLDKTMFQEAAGTAARLKQGCPVARYFLVIEYLDMTPEDPRLTAIDNVFLLRHAKRLPVNKRDIYDEVAQQHKSYPIDYEVVWRIIQEVQATVDAVQLRADDVLKRGSFV